MKNKKNLTIILFLVIGTSVSSQEEGKLSLSIWYQPQYSISNYYANPTASESDYMQNGVNLLQQSLDEEKDKNVDSYTYSTGINLKYQLNKNIYLQTGVGFLQQKIRWCVFDKEDYDAMENYWWVYDIYSEEDRWYEEYWSEEFYYLSLPIKIGYIFPIKEKFNIGLEAGLMNNFFLYGYTNIITKLNSGDVLKHKTSNDPVYHKARKYHLSLTTNLTVNYNISDKLSIFINPGATYDIIHSAEDIDNFIWFKNVNIYAQTGISWHF